eukprot:367275-Pyramimonas_sp.AAC.1
MFFVIVITSLFPLPPRARLARLRCTCACLACRPPASARVWRVSGLTTIVLCTCLACRTAVQARVWRVSGLCQRVLLDARLTD